MFVPSSAPRGAPERPAGLLLTPGPYPVAQPWRRVIAIFVIVVITVVWLLAQGYSIYAALEAVAAARALTAALIPCLTGPPPADS
jgi:hypothetical protein